MKGAYLLLMENPEHINLKVGKLGELRFNKGYYAYVGSALNGIDQRIQRHLRKQKKIHWHIDYLLVHCRIIGVYYKEHNQPQECTIADLLQQKLRFVPGFGCTDCTCASHLFYGAAQEIIKVADTFHMTPYPLDTNP